VTTGPMAGRQHDGTLTTYCTCGATFTSGDTGHDGRVVIVGHDGRVRCPRGTS